MSNVVERLYDDPPQGIPKTVFVPVDVDDPELYEEWLTLDPGLEGGGAGAAARARSASCRRP